MTESPLFTVHSSVKPEWIDYNGHMNMGYYLVAFDEVGTDSYFDFLGIGREHHARENRSTFTLASNIDFLKEVFANEPLRFTTRLLDFDHKRIHYFHCMYHAEQGYLAATNECLTMYMDMDTRRSAVFSEAQQARFEIERQRAEAQEAAPRVGRKLGIRR
ncbi:MAG: thioesterase family protein [Halieaceae bacterium]|nr:thioesterase family protein [Halieaceae bacterium]